jgi:regulator of sirC expression with transglutaminase-like and TPR domain
VRQRFVAVVSGAGFDLVEAALLVAAEEYPDLDVARECARVRLLAAEAARRVDGETNIFARLDGLAGWLFEDLGFRGNLHRYNDPRNSFLNEVLDRRLGIPLTLTILYLEVVRAAGFTARGVSLPGHFVARVETGDRTVFVDPFNRGRIVTEDDCRELVSRTTGRPSLFRRELLAGTDERGAICRLLLNLKHLYVEQQEYGRALAAVERLLEVRPDDPTEIRDRGFLKAHLGHAGPAIADLEQYLVAEPQAADGDAVRGRVVWLKRRLSQKN